MSRLAGSPRNGDPAVASPAVSSDLIAEALDGMRGTSLALLESLKPVKTFGAHLAAVAAARIRPGEDRFPSGTRATGDGIH